MASDQQQPPPLRVTRAAAKRRAVDGGAAGGTISGATNSKKRPALTNLSNSSNVVPSRPSKPHVQPRRSSNVRTYKRVAPPLVVSPPKADVSPEELTTYHDSPPATVVVSDVTMVASLERKTSESLYISSQRKRSQPSPPEKLKSGIKDIDADIKDPQLCPSYAKDIYQYLRMTELKRRPSTDFMEAVQHDITAGMRAILVDWLVEVAEEYKLIPDTLYLAVSFIDRFLSLQVVSRQRLQLLGVSCMLIASKYEEVSAPQVEEFCYITDNTYEKEELLSMERQVLCELRFELTTPTAKTFLRRFLQAAQTSYPAPETRLDCLANYLAELSLVEYSFVKYLPSMVAASAALVALVTIHPEPGYKPWTPTLVHYSGYKASQLAECVVDILDLQRNANESSLRAVREKYTQQKFRGVANLESPTLSGHWFVDNNDST